MLRLGFTVVFYNSRGTLGLHEPQPKRADAFRLRPGAGRGKTSLAAQSSGNRRAVRRDRRRRQPDRRRALALLLGAQRSYAGVCRSRPVPWAQADQHEEPGGTPGQAVDGAPAEETPSRGAGPLTHGSRPRKNARRKAVAAKEMKSPRGCCETFGAPRRLARWISCVPASRRGAANRVT